MLNWVLNGRKNQGLHPQGRQADQASETSQRLGAPAPEKLQAGEGCSPGRLTDQAVKRTQKQRLLADCADIEQSARDIEDFLKKIPEEVFRVQPHEARALRKIHTLAVRAAKRFRTLDSVDWPQK